MNIDINTKFITLIGSPLTQSFAAQVQNAVYEVTGINLCYFYTETEDSHLSDIINGIRHMPSFVGCAITKPNKVKVIQYLDELDSLCKKIGACNTVVRSDDGKLRGFNTDALGFLASLKEEGGIDPKDKSFFCLGAGGAGRAICSVLAYKGASKIYVTDVLARSAKNLVENINVNFSQIAEYVSYLNYSKIDCCDVIINASGIGMGSTEGQSPVPIKFMSQKQFYFDVCYNPVKSQFLINAENKGCKILNGLGMSLFQGMEQIELWTGKKVSIEMMRQALRMVLSEESRKRKYGQ